MISRGRGCSKMPCESCAVQFSVFRRKRSCCECERFYCAACLRRGGGAMCAACRLLSTRPLSRHSIAHLKVRDIQCFLQRQNVSTRGCVEKEELLSLCVSHVNSAAFKRRGARSSSSAFSSLKGFTNNINEFLNSAFDLRNGPHPSPAPNNGNCYNASHTHSRAASPPQTQARERFTTTPGGERDIEVPVPAASMSRSASEYSARVDSADCFEIEDIDDAGWEFISRPAEPLPPDSEVLITVNDNAASNLPGSAPTSPSASEAEAGAGARATRAARGGLEPRDAGTPLRAASELDLRRPASTDTDTTSLQDEPLTLESSEPVSLGAMSSERSLERLSVKQLKQLLVRNRVEFRGCLERDELLARARTLYRDHARHTHDAENLPIEDSCKICMAAPLECVLLECGHMAACTACSKQLAECPICRQYVVRAVRVFRS